MKLIIDENISFAKEAFGDFGEVELLHGRKINKDCLIDADALIVRSITDVNSELLESTSVKFVGTATIGTDHIDKTYLKEKGIRFTDAKGCNADAVAEYVFTALMNICVYRNIPLEGKTIGVVGIGNIGSRIVRLAKALGLNIIQNDPPLQRKTGSAEFRPLDEVLEADIITIHVPLNTSGEDKTVNMFNKEVLKKLKEDTILINASRGQVINNRELFEAVRKKNLFIVLDVWEKEPDINTLLLKNVELGTPHIAGYSLEGKVNGTKIIYDNLCSFTGAPAAWNPHLPLPEDNHIQIENCGNIVHDLKVIFNKIYDIKRDDKELKKMLWFKEEERGNYFDLLRKNYPLRREFINYNINLKNQDERLKEVLKCFRFNITN